MLSHYCNRSPYLRKTSRLGTRLYALEFLTRVLPCFNQLHSLFYYKGIKLIPNNIYEILTILALARGAAPRFYLNPWNYPHHIPQRGIGGVGVNIKTHLIMGDGYVASGGLTLCTNNYSAQDTVRLMNVLIIRYRLKCTVHLKRRPNKNSVEYMIYISKHSMPLLRSIIIPYMHSSMMYKVL